MVVDTLLRIIHMKQKTCLLLLFFLLAAGIVDAQNPLPKHQPDRQKRNQSDTSRSEVFVDGVKTPKKKYRNQEDHARFGIKCYYNAPGPQIVQSVRSDYQNSGYVDIIGKSTVGPSLRIPLGRTFYLQTEALFGLYSDWEGAKREQGFWNQLTYSYSNRTSSYMWVPVYVGVRWAPIKVFAVRGFVGPRLNFLISSESMSFVKDHYTLMAGGGLDLLRIFSIEMGYQTDMSRFSPIAGSDGWFVAASLMF